jgi:class 3 adenylate cyclase
VGSDSVRELPAGTVTFVFTDVEGSTRLARELRERYRDVLDDHRRLLREAFAGAGGYEVDTQGDAFFFAFPRALNAVEAAVAAQRALAAHPWPDGTRVRVRIGIHTGEATPSDGRYVGLAVHRAARIASAGHGGQILVSGTTRDLVEDELPRDQRLRDLGEHALKDLPRPERLFRLHADGLEENDAPPALEPAEDPFEAEWRSMSEEIVRSVQADVRASLTNRPSALGARARGTRVPDFRTLAIVAGILIFGVLPIVALLLDRG